MTIFILHGDSCRGKGRVVSEWSALPAVSDAIKTNSPLSCSTQSIKNFMTERKEEMVERAGKNIRGD